MADFMIRFLLCNIFISGIIGLLIPVKWLFRNCLSSRMQYHLWFLLLGLLFIPFIPFRPAEFPQIFLYLINPGTTPVANGKSGIGEFADTNSTETTNWLNDFALSVSSQTPSIAGYILCGIWISGVLVMIFFMLKSMFRLRRLKRSALPLQNSEVRKLYHNCLLEMNIRKELHIYSTAFLRAPIITGFIKPCIYLPIHLISDYNATAIRYMLLHELQHYNHKDTLINYLMNIAGIIYWFNPFVRYAFREMRSDREIACDTSVLKMLNEDDYADYGNTLIHFAEKVSFTPFPFATGMSGTMKQMQKRIMNIASYEKPTLWKQLRGFTAFLITAALLMGFAPVLSAYAANTGYYQWDSSNKNITYVDYSSYFEEYEGSFVLYDLENDTWRIHDMEHAALRVAPDSTYKIYDALFGLEEGVITPENSFIAWNGESYPFEAWNANQTLQSAMNASVNWYFQTVDEKLGASDVYSYIQEIEYGNEDMRGDFPTYWMESSLEISSIEQVELLTRLYNNSFGFAPENINAVKDSICLSSSEDGTFYGKTGTGRIDGQDVNGWFVGYVETADNTYFFATNIGGESGANGNNATEITMSVLADMNISIRKH